MAFEYKGIEIRFSEVTGEFRATVGKETVIAPSLAALKKRIDKMQAAPVFEPFECVDTEQKGWRDDATNQVVRFKVTGIEKAKGKRSWNNRPRWQVDTQHSNTIVVFPATEQNIALIEQITVLTNEARKIAATYEKSINELYAQVERKECPAS